MGDFTGHMAYVTPWESSKYRFHSGSKMKSFEKRKHSSEHTITSNISILEVSFLSCCTFAINHIGHRERGCRVLLKGGENLNKSYSFQEQPWFCSESIFSSLKAISHTIKTLITEFIHQVEEIIIILISHLYPYWWRAVTIQGDPPRSGAWLCNGDSPVQLAKKE